MFATLCARTKYNNHATIQIPHNPCFLHPRRNFRESSKKTFLNVSLLSQLSRTRHFISAIRHPCFRYQIKHYRLGYIDTTISKNPFNPLLSQTLLQNLNFHPNIYYLQTYTKTRDFYKHSNIK